MTLIYQFQAFMVFWRTWRQDRQEHIADGCKMDSFMEQLVLQNTCHKVNSYMTITVAANEPVEDWP